MRPAARRWRGQRRGTRAEVPAFLTTHLSMPRHSQPVHVISCHEDSGGLPGSVAVAFVSRPTSSLTAMRACNRVVSRLKGLLGTRTAAGCLAEVPAVCVTCCGGIELALSVLFGAAHSPLHRVEPCLVATQTPRLAGAGGVVGHAGAHPALLSSRIQLQSLEPALLHVAWSTPPFC